MSVDDRSAGELVRELEGLPARVLAVESAVLELGRRVDALLELTAALTSLRADLAARELLPSAGARRLWWGA